MAQFLRRGALALLLFTSWTGISVLGLPTGSDEAHSSGDDGAFHRVLPGHPIGRSELEQILSSSASRRNDLPPLLPGQPSTNPSWHPPRFPPGFEPHVTIAFLPGQSSNSPAEHDPQFPPGFEPPITVDQRRNEEQSTLNHYNVLRLTKYHENAVTLAEKQELAQARREYAQQLLSSNIPQPADAQTSNALQHRDSSQPSLPHDEDPSGAPTQAVPLRAAHPDMVAEARRFEKGQVYPPLHGVLYAEKGWRAPTQLTPLQYRLSKFRWGRAAHWLKPTGEGRARFYGALHKVDRNQGLIRYEKDPGLVDRMSAQPLSGNWLVARRNAWKEANLRIIFAQSDARAYGIIDGQILKQMFPTLSEADRTKLKDGEVAILEIDKPQARGFTYRLHSVLDMTFFPHLLH